MSNFILRFSEQAKDDIRHQKNSGNKIVLNKITKLLEELTESPFSGTGKSEPLKYNLTGYWSRRISKEHRLVYEVSENIVYIISVRGHY